MFCSTLTAANVTLQFVPSGANGLPSEGGVMRAVRAVKAAVRARQSLRICILFDQKIWSSVCTLRKGGDLWQQKNISGSSTKIRQANTAGVASHQTATSLVHRRKATSPKKIAGTTRF